MMSRKGASLVEVLVVIAITAVLIGLMLGAVQKVRSVASGLQDKNKLRQIVLAGHNYATANEGRLPSATSNDSIYYLEAVLPYLEVNGPVYYPYPPWGTGYKILPIYIFDSDYSIPWFRSGKDTVIEVFAPVSVAVNAVALHGITSLAADFPDGTSNTIGVSERLFVPQDRSNTFTYRGLNRGFPFDDRSITRGNFADDVKLDHVPVTTGSPPQTRASTPGVTFQVVPKLIQSDGRQLQALHPSGLKVAMLDGSVRTIHPGVSEATFWGLVTPAAGDIAELD